MDTLLHAYCPVCGHWKQDPKGLCSYCADNQTYQLTDIEKKRARAYGVWLARHNNAFVLADFTDDTTMEVVRNGK